uniref:Uncharacterized protein n=1 Tax=Strongyloides stercoralis TaxID=6248 RepID=A0A0K0EG20_STRER
MNQDKFVTLSIQVIIEGLKALVAEKYPVETDTASLEEVKTAEISTTHRSMDSLDVRIPMFDGTENPSRFLEKMKAFFYTREITDEKLKLCHLKLFCTERVNKWFRGVATYADAFKCIQKFCARYSKESIRHQLKDFKLIYYSGEALNESLYEMLDLVSQVRTNQETFAEDFHQDILTKFETEKCNLNDIIDIYNNLPLKLRLGNKFMDWKKACEKISLPLEYSDKLKQHAKKLRFYEEIKKSKKLSEMRVDNSEVPNIKEVKNKYNIEINLKQEQLNKSKRLLLELENTANKIIEENKNKLNWSLDVDENKKGVEELKVDEKILNKKDVNKKDVGESKVDYTEIIFDKKDESKLVELAYKHLQETKKGLIGLSQVSKYCFKVSIVIPLDRGVSFK